MSDPKTAEEYDRLFSQRSRLEGTGFAAVMHMPCPFCASAGFVEFPMIGVDAWESVCKECDRGCRLEVSPTERGGIRWEFVQTQGEDPPPYLPPMRRAPSSKGKDA